MINEDTHTHTQEQWGFSSVL